MVSECAHRARPRSPLARLRGLNQDFQLSELDLAASREIAAITAKVHSHWQGCALCSTPSLEKLARSRYNFVPRGTIPTGIEGVADSQDLRGRLHLISELNTFGLRHSFTGSVSTIGETPVLGQMRNLCYRISRPFVKPENVPRETICIFRVLCDRFRRLEVSVQLWDV